MVGSLEALPGKSSKDVRDVDAGWLRRRIGVVQQEPVLFGFSIADFHLLIIRQFLIRLSIFKALLRIS